MAATACAVTSANQITRTISPIKIHVLNQTSEKETKQHLLFIESEARNGTKSIGFVPRAGLHDAARRGRVCVVTNNDDRVGFCVYGGSNGVCRVFQMWIRIDARLLTHGRALVNYLTTWSAKRNMHTISLWCLADLPATLFWRALGFKRAGERCRSSDRRRLQIQWQIRTLAAFAQISADAIAASVGSDPCKPWDPPLHQAPRLPPKLMLQQELF